MRNPFGFKRLRSTAIGSALLGALFVAAFASPASARQPPKVVVETVRQSVFVQRVEALGDLRPMARVEIAATVTEQIEKFHAGDGARVKKGDVLVELRHSQEDALLEEATATRDEALEALEDAQKLFERGAGSETLLKQRRRDAAVAEARVKSAQAQIDDRLLRAPFDGRIGIHLVSPGATVEPGDIIMRLIRDDVLKLDFTVPNTVLWKLKPGAEIEARARALPNELFRGQISTIDAEADPTTRSVLVRSLIPNDERKLLPGLLMEVVLLLNERRTLVVDEKSIIPFGKETFVMRVVDRDGQPYVERRQVTTGARRVGEVEILDGLDVGDVVVTEGLLKIRPGQKVAPVRKEPKANGADAPGDIASPARPNAG